MQNVKTKKSIQRVTAAQFWRERMVSARRDLPEDVGQQDVLNWIASECPELDRLTNATRWRNAWLSRVADPEITQLVEKAAVYFKGLMETKKDRLGRQKLYKASK